MNIWLTEIWRSWRASLRKPGFLLLASGVLALGIGASVAVFTLIDQVLMKPLPLPQASQLVVAGFLQGRHAAAVSPQQYQHIQHLDGVESIGLLQAGPRANIAGSGTPKLVPLAYFDHGLLPTLGIQPLLGRNFTQAEDVPHGARVILLGHGLWQRRFGGDPAVVGQSLQVEGEKCTIIGVLPASFDALGFEADVVLPMGLPPNSRNDGTNYVAVLRLADGVSAASVGAQVNARLHALYRQTGNDYWQRARFGVQSLRERQRDDARPVLVMFSASAAFVLLIALVNLGNLMLLRALARNQDAAVRNALGASRWHLALPALAEGLLIGIAGAGGGVGLAALGLHLLRGFIPPEWLAGAALHVGPVVWLLALATGLLGAALAAALGLWRPNRADRIDELRSGGRSGIGHHSGRLGRVLVVAQVALATALLCSAGVFLHTLYDAARTPLGFSAANVLTFELAPVKATYPDAEAVHALSERLVQRLGNVPGVSAAAMTTNLPADTWGGQFNLGDLHTGDGVDFWSQYRAVSPDYFGVFRIPVIKGRSFSRNDVRGGEPVAMVSRSLANKEYGGHALGKIVRRGSGAQAWQARIVGVVGDNRQFGPLEPAPEVLYVPLAQVPDKALAIFRSFEPMRVAVKVHGTPGSYREAVRAAVAEVAPQQPIDNVRSMEAVTRTTTATVRLNLLLVGIFAALAVALAAAGLYAVMAVAVAAREREFGVRMALGSSPRRLTRLVMAGGLLQILAGLALGVLLAWTLSSVIRAVMEQIDRQQAFDPVAVVGVSAVLAIAGLLACLLPALRAARVQPMHVLRGE